MRSGKFISKKFPSRCSQEIVAYLVANLYLYKIGNNLAVNKEK